MHMLKTHFQNRNTFKSCAFFLLFITSFSFSSCSSVKNKKWKTDSVINKKYLHQINETNDYLESINFQGSVLVSKKDKVIFAKGYGLSDKKAENSSQNTIHTTFEAGSITKQMTAAAIMQLVEQKKLSVDDKLSKYFPDYEYGEEITIKMLLTMHSGLTDCINATYDFFPSSVAAQINKKQLANQELDRDIVLTHFYKAPLFTKPNSTFFYCNTDYYLLARILEIVSGLSYEEYMAKNIFSKCGMINSNTKFQQTDAKGYDFQNRYYSIPASLALGCGDVNSNVLDIFKWNTLFTHGKVVSKKSFNEMIDTESYGYGLYKIKNTILHGGNTNVFNSYNSYDLKNGISIIVLVNRPIYECNSTQIAEKIKLFFNF